MSMAYPLSPSLAAILLLPLPSLFFKSCYFWAASKEAATLLWCMEPPSGQSYYPHASPLAPSESRCCNEADSWLLWRILPRPWPRPCAVGAAGRLLMWEKGRGGRLPFWTSFSKDELKMVMTEQGSEHESFIKNKKLIELEHRRMVRMAISLRKNIRPYLDRYINAAKAQWTSEGEIFVKVWYWEQV